jgi:hypothetical protein
LQLHSILPRPRTAGPRPLDPEEGFAPRHPPPSEHALMGGIAALVLRRVEVGEGGASAVPPPDLVELLLPPYLGPVAARKLAAEAATAPEPAIPRTSARKTSAPPGKLAIPSERAGCLSGLNLLSSQMSARGVGMVTTGEAGRVNPTFGLRPETERD